jgi:hypothetical protein
LSPFNHILKNLSIPFKILDHGINTMGLSIAFSIIQGTQKSETNKNTLYVNVGLGNVF